jgi:hypothetical protein
MKTLSVIAISLFVFLVPGEFIKAQEDVHAFDTIHLFHHDFYSNDYSLEDTLIHTISIKTTAATQMNDVHFKLGGSILGGIATIATGIGFGSAKEVDWYLTSTIRTSNPKLDWTFDVYCPGYVEKERTRVKNDDGSFSVETNYVNKFLWQSGAIGFVIEAGDSIGWHYVYRFPRTDSAVRKWSRMVYKGNPEHPVVNYKEFALIGEFTGKESAILFNSEDNRIYIYNGSELSGIYQCQNPPKLTLSKKKRKPFEQPFLLVNTMLSAWGRMDVLRLAMEGIRMKSAIESL